MVSRSLGSETHERSRESYLCRRVALARRAGHRLTLAVRRPKDNALAQSVLGKVSGERVEFGTRQHVKQIGRRVDRDVECFAQMIPPVSRIVGNSGVLQQ